ncbi:DUF349 domain-containing protein [Thalassomonas sp. M1454]|uniref:DUF349 domain-containing protein n=1 Tax=Thalassomonas sp. M1454 TaxID=2594477 RepID=UPI00117F343E|nr:DUF349 domain-containing protein [Thalassomonas sp. M1454]TRX56850.1 DUF349 domain-containing protein [Thalassomonas sp. M1454]
MILTKFFKPKWQHQDAPVRITALNSLSLDNSEHIAILENLVANDESELVRRAALIKLNQYKFWLKASKDNSKSAIKAFARAKVQEQILVQGTGKLELQVKKDFLEQCDKTAFLEQWLLVEQEHSLVEMLLEKVNKPHLLIQFFINCNNEALQLTLLSRFDTVEQLEKLAKKITNTAVASEINAKLDRLNQAIEKPIKLKKQCQLVLSKLLALKDLNDYVDMRDRKVALEQEWQQLVADIDCLTASDKTELLAKYDAITKQLTKNFAVQEEAYQHQQFILEQAQKKQQQLNNLNEKVTLISKQITQAVFENISIDEAKLEAELVAVKQETQSSDISNLDQQKLFEQLDKLAKKLKQLPHVAQCVSDATSLISKLSTLALPTNIEELNLRKPVFDDWLGQWQRIDNLVDDILPESIVSARKELESTWQQALKPLVKEQESSFNLVGKKISELKRLINFGKYKSAFGLHKKLTFMIESLSAKQQERLQKDFAVVSDKINELHELESFIVTPKKQQALDDILKLINAPLENPLEQAKEVKRFRKHWNNLGRADESMEADLNNKFNELIELAFAPCRAFYGEQAKIRETNLRAKQDVIAKLQALNTELNNSEVNYKQIDTRLHKLILEWRDIGEVDREQQQVISKQFSALVDPVRSAVTAYHEDNASAKTQLINKAKLELENEDVFSAINNLKNLQKQWTTIEYAGKNKENQLWQAFRKINDQVFSRRDAVKETEQKQRQEQSAQLEQECNDVLAKFSAAGNIADLTASKQELNTFADKLSKQTPVHKGLVNKVKRGIDDLNTKLKTLENDKKKAHFLNLFSVIENIVSGKLANDELANDEQFLQLNKHWQKVVSKNCNVEADLTKQAVLTLELEILADVETPKALLAERMQVQVSMLADKLKSGEAVSLNSKLEEWINSGLQSNELQAFVTRIKPIFIG